jgi:hypothetical protein
MVSGREQLVSDGWEDEVESFDLVWNIPIIMAQHGDLYTLPSTNC